MADINNCFGLTEKYSILTILKDSDKGTVYLVKHKSIGVKRIIKQISRQSVYEENFFAEVAILKSLNYKFIPQIIDIEEDSSCFYAVQEYCEGQNLFDYIRQNGVFTESKAIEYGIKLLKILEFLHIGNSFWVCHLDIQPKNIIINNKDIYLVDFENGKTSLDRDIRKNILATKGFAPPEQFTNDSQTKITDLLKMDIYSIGAVLLYMTTGRYSEDFNWEHIMIKEDLSTRFKKVVLSALNKNAEYRQESAAILKNKLLEIKDKNNVRQSIKKHKPYIISVAGIRSRIGTTHISIAITNILRKMNLEAVYHENNSTGLLCSLAKHNKNISFNKGYFIYNDCKFRPQYSENIRIGGEEKVVIRDEGVFSPSENYGHILVIVAGGSLLEWNYTKDILNTIEDFSNDYCTEIFIILNLCDEKCYVEKRLSTSLKIHYINYHPDIFSVINSDFNNGFVEEIIQCIDRESENYYIKKTKENNACIKTTSDRNYFRKKR